jgi:hypothetical protein
LCLARAFRAAFLADIAQIRGKILISLKSRPDRRVAAAGIFSCLILAGAGVSARTNAAPGISASGPPVANRIKLDFPPATSPSACENPYSAPFTSDWGRPPAYRDSYKDGKITSELRAQGYIDPPTQLPSWLRPKYLENHIFWLSRENKPGQSVLMSGAFTPRPKRIRLASIPPGATEIKPLLDASPVIVASTAAGATGLAFKIPANFSDGPLAFRIEDPPANAVDATVNLPEVQWALGVMPTPTGGELPEDVFSYPPSPCGAPIGGVLKVFGKNYLPGAKIYLADSFGAGFELPVVFQDENAMAASIPRNVAPGNYSLWVGNAAHDAASSNMFPIKIRDRGAVKTKAISCPELRRRDKTTVSARIQKCLDLDIPANPAETVGVLHLPAGTFELEGSITFHPGQYLRGAGVRLTKLIGISPAPNDGWLNGTHHFGFADISFRGPLKNSLLRSDLTGDPRASGFVTLNRVALTVEALEPASVRQPVIQLSGPAIQIIDSTLTSLGGVSSSIAYADGVWISGFDQFQGPGGWAAVGESQNVIVEHSSFSGPPPDAGATGGGFVFTLTFSRFSRFPRSEQVQRNAYLGYSALSNMMAPGVGANMAFGTDGGSQAYYGTIASSSFNSVTLAHEPDWSFTGNAIPDGLVVSIIAGTGAGQFRHVVGYDGRRIDVASPWAVSPNQTSVVVVSQANENMIISHNVVKNCAADAILFYGLIFSSVIEKNILTDAGNGINVMAFGPYGDAFYNSTFDVEVLNNEITNSQDLRDGTESGGIILSEQPGATLSGVLVRGNSIADPQHIRVSQGYSNNIANMIESNQYSVDRDRKLMSSAAKFNPGLLVEDINYAP